MALHGTVIPGTSELVLVSISYNKTGTCMLKGLLRQTKKTTRRRFRGFKSDENKVKDH